MTQRLLELSVGDFYDTVPVERPIDLTPSQEGRWYVVRTEPNREMTAQANMLLRRIPFYIPTILRPARISAKAHAAGASHPDVPHPLFPGLIFIAEVVVEAKDALIRTVPGLLARPYMRLGDDLAVLSAEGMQVVQYIEQGERQVYLMQRGRPAALKNLKIGDHVCTLVDGLIGTIAEMDDKGRITLFVEIMKRTVRVKLSADQVEPE